MKERSGVGGPGSGARAPNPESRVPKTSEQADGVAR